MDELIEKLDDLSVTEKPKMPKGKRSAYAIFISHMAEEMKRKGETNKGPFFKICSKKWKEVPIKEKEKFQRKAKEDAVRYNKEMAKYEECKEQYDKFIDEVHDKGLLNELEDQQKLMDLTLCSTKSNHKTKPNVESSGEHTSDDQNSDDNPADDTLELLNNNNFKTTNKNSKKEKRSKNEVKDDINPEEEEEEDEEEVSEDEISDEEEKQKDNEETVIDEEEDEEEDEEQEDNEDEEGNEESGSESEDEGEDGGDENEDISSDEESEEEVVVKPSKKKPGRRLF